MSNKTCGNVKCLQKNTQLHLADRCCEIYFGLQNIPAYLCKACLEIGKDYGKKCVSALYQKECILDVPRLSVGEPELIDLDLEAYCNDNTNNLSAVENVLTWLSNEEIEKMTTELIRQCDLETQIGVCTSSLDTDMSILVAGYSHLEAEVSSLEREVDAARSLYLASRDKITNNTRSMQLKSVSIDEDGNEKLESEASTTISKGRSDSGQSSAKPLRTCLNNNKRLSSTNNLASVHVNGDSKMTKDEIGKRNNKVGGDVQLLSRFTTPPNRQTFLFETPKSIPRIMLKGGDKVYAMRTNTLGGWSIGEVDLVIRATNAKPTFRIKFETKKRGRTGADTLVKEFKELTAKQLAYNVPCPFILPVGTRVIGLFNDDCAEEGLQPQEPIFYAGIVAEPPKNANNSRYLVFFDDGYAQYVQPSGVLLVCESSDPVWNDVHPDSQEFIRVYIQKYPERPMVRLNKGDVLSTEWSGQWWQSRVVEVDCSLAKMYFGADNRYEWIYRGSTRLAPLYDSEKRLAERSSNTVTGSSPRGARGLPRNIRAGQNKLTIEYLYGNEDIYQKKSEKNEKNKAMAKKSTTAVPGKREIVKESTTALVAKPVKAGQPKRVGPNLTEFEGKIQTITFPPGIPKEPRDYVPHMCDTNCVILYEPNTLHNEKHINPLSLVFHFGWAREILKAPRKQVCYRAPCGRRLRDMPELHTFIMTTNFNLSIDYFCFDVSIDCQTEFVPSRVLWSIKDISYGKEEIPVQCINSLDHDYPAYVEYTRHSVKGEGIPLDLDGDFLVCCDCTDDCQDKEKCACWQLTYECYKKTRPVTDIDLIGYSYRTLKTHQVSGIFECNPRCKCRKTCLNRVVQNPTKWRLQVFKTSNRGWAIRALNDIPEGSFICIYAGQILTEHLADQDGKNYGDEYLAELNFIEVCEEHKQGYEAQCVDYEEDVNMDVEERSNDENCKMSKRSVVPSEKLNENERDSGYFDLDKDKDSSGANRTRTRGSQLSTKSTKSINGPTSFGVPLSNSQHSEKDSEALTTRDYFKKGEECFIVDAKSIGSIGRYLNHSCSPNVYVQNVFVDTHDLRFPWVAFFAFKLIKAGSELMWDYNYEVGSVPGRVFYCQCGSPDCRGRLL